MPRACPPRVGPARASRRHPSCGRDTARATLESAMAKVTALHMDTITEKSGHQMTGMAVSVCLTPAAPSPLPIPYPTMGSVAEGIIDPCMRTKIEGAKILTVGGCMKACHGNEPGTLKEVVSLNTGGPCFPWLGAPNVIIEL